MEKIIPEIKICKKNSAKFANFCFFERSEKSVLILNSNRLSHDYYMPPFHSANQRSVRNYPHEFPRVPPILSKTAQKQADIILKKQEDKQKLKVIPLDSFFGALRRWHFLKLP